MKATYKQWSRQALMALLAAVMVLSMTVFAASSDGTGESGTDTGTETETAMPFADVSESAWYYDAVLDAYQQQLMIGTGETTFSPSAGTTRAMVVTTLYRLAGEPDVTGLEMLFEDVVEGRYYYNALLWAYDVGVAEGRSATVFDPNTPITREETVTFFGRYAQYILEEDVASVAAGVDLSGYTDADKVGNYAQESMSWAVATGLVIGTSATTLSPDRICNRAELATMLSRFYPCQAEADVETISAADAIVGLETIGFVDVDGTKISAIVLEYSEDLSGAEVDTETYEVSIFTPDDDGYILNYDNIGVIKDVYVNDEANISETGGTGTGNYVVIELETDYVRTSEPSYTKALAASVEQVKAVETDTVKIVNDGSTQDNYISEDDQSATEGTWTVQGLEQYKFYTDDAGLWGADGPALTVEDCFNEKTGETYDYTLGYALYVPEDYDPNGSYALVTVDHTITGDPHPFEALLTNYGPTYFISDEAQQIVKDEHGLDGLIVVVPLIIERVDDNACVPAMWMALVTLWDQLQEDYAIDSDYVYGAGQSMGGMLLMQTNTYRDNYFAGMLCYGNQWGQNYYKDTVFARGMSSETYVETSENTTRHYPSTADSYYIWDYYYDSEGNKVYDDWDPYNFYYMVSDDNLMVFNSYTNSLSYNVWTETNYLYSDLVGYSIPWLTDLDPTASIEEQNAAIEAQLAAGNTYGDQEMGLWIFSWSEGGNDGTAIWSRRVTANYEWLLKQSRTDEMEREKLDLNKPFELADEQDTSDARLVSGYYDKDTGEPIYYLTGKSGSGTKFYNTSWLQLGSNVSADANPGWLPDGLEYPVSAATIQSVVPVITDGKITAFAVEYDVDMSGIVIWIKGDPVYNSKGEAYDDYFVTIDPYSFYDENEDLIDCTITNVYVNDSAATVEDAERNSGSGCYVIVEIEPVSASVDTMSVIQRTTVYSTGSNTLATATSRRYYGGVVE